MNQNIYIIEDETKIIAICRDYLIADGFEVVSATDGYSGMELFHSTNPILIILDLMLPVIDGYEICKRIRSESAVPIIILTARHTETDKLLGLELGADDYITKPFSPRELVARIRTVLRRVKSDLSMTGQSEGTFHLDRDHFRVKINDGEITLTPTEFDILETLCSQPGQIFSRSQLLSVARGITFESYERAIDSHIRNLRRKIDNDEDSKHIITVHGFGYKFVE